MVNLTELIRSRGFSITNLAKVSGVPLTTVATLARGEREFKNATVATALKLSQVLGLTVEEMYTAIYDPISDK